jgi:hypothetical protein
VKSKRLLLIPIVLAALVAGGATRIVQDQCGPFTDVTPGFCPYVLELYYLGVTAGTSATTFSPDDPLTRGQGSVFVAKGLNQALARSSRRAALGQWWTTTPHWDLGLGITTVGHNPEGIASDGADVWVANISGGSVSRVRASDGAFLENWTGAPGAIGVLPAMGRILVIGSDQPSGPAGFLYVLDPAAPAGAVQVAANLGGDGLIPSFPIGVAFDGEKIWIADYNRGALVVTPAAAMPWPVSPVPGFTNPVGVIYDGSNVWMTSQSALAKLDSAGNVLQNVTIGLAPAFPVFDGTNIWVPNLADDSISVVAASTGAVVATLTGNGLLAPWSTAFDGERILVTNLGRLRGDPTSVSLFRAADLAPLGNFPALGREPWGACSDGANFWISFNDVPGTIGRF